MTLVVPNLVVPYDEKELLQSGVIFFRNFFDIIIKKILYEERTKSNSKDFVVYVPKTTNCHFGNWSLLYGPQIGPKFEDRDLDVWKRNNILSPFEALQYFVMKYFKYFMINISDPLISKVTIIKIFKFNSATYKCHLLKTLWHKQNHNNFIMQNIKNPIWTDKVEPYLKYSKEIYDIYPFHVSCGNKKYFL